MDGYSRMDLMSMSDEDLRRVLKEEGEELPSYTVAMIVEELQRRAEMPKYEYETFEDEEQETDMTGEEPDMTGEEPKEENNDADLTPEESLKKEIETVEKLKKERTKMLIVASVAALAAALLIVGFMLYLYFTGQL